MSKTKKTIAKSSTDDSSGTGTAVAIQAVKELRRELLSIERELDRER